MMLKDFANNYAEIVCNKINSGRILAFVSISLFFCFKLKVQIALD